MTLLNTPRAKLVLKRSSGVLCRPTIFHELWSSCLMMYSEVWCETSWYTSIFHGLNRLLLRFVHEFWWWYVVRYHDRYHDISWQVPNNGTFIFFLRLSKQYSGCRDNAIHIRLLVQIRPFLVLFCSLLFPSWIVFFRRVAPINRVVRLKFERSRCFFSRAYRVPLGLGITN